MPSHLDEETVSFNGWESEGAHPLPPSPTSALPGTEEKVLVMIERCKGGYALFHPLDAGWDSGTYRMVYRILRL